MLLQGSKNPFILHSDFESQYTSIEFSKYISDAKIITHSFSGKGGPYDNACIESFHASLKKEAVNFVKYYDFDTARLTVFNIPSPGTKEKEYIVAYAISRLKNVKI